MELKHSEKIKKANDFCNLAIESWKSSIEFFLGLTDIITLIRIMLLEVLCYRHEITPGIYDDEFEMQELIKEIKNELKLIDA